ISEWSGRGNVTASEVLQVQYAPQEGKSLATGLEDHPAQESSDKEENNRLKSTLSVQLKLVLNRFPAVTKKSTQKRLQLYVLKHMQMLANMGQHVPEIESTEYIKLYLQIFKLELEEYMKRKEAHTTARSTATPAESVDYDAIRHIETTTSKVVNKEVKILQPPQIPGQHVTIKEEALERSAPAGAENSQVIVRRIPMG
ncbi:hypothetical protein C0995_014913, partial [Termitomyces sp. Mi166